MIKKLLTVLIIGLGMVWVGEVYGCPEGWPCWDPVNIPMGAADPAFLGVDNVPGKPLAVVRKEAQKSAAASAPGEADLAAESGEWANYAGKLKESPKEAYGIALEGWSQHFSVSFKKALILKVRGLVTITDESSNLDFMLDCLENPPAERQKLLDLARGNGLERKQAATRLSLMKLNPDLKTSGE